jgi:hypothetical protein
MILASKVLTTPGFLDHYTTTVGKRIYTPFTVGEAHEFWSLEAQVAVCAHEHQHVEQLNRDGLKFLWSYATSTMARAAYEIEAYETSLDVQWFLRGQTVDPHHYAEGLANYGCRAADVATARLALDVYVMRVKQGTAQRTRAASLAIAYLSTLRS